VSPALGRGLEATACAGMCVFGIVMALLGSVLPIVSAELDFGLARAGDLLALMNFAMLLTSLAVGPALDRFGFRLPLALGPLLAAAGLAQIARAGAYRELLLAAPLLGAGGAVLNTATNALIADLYPESKPKNAALNRLGVFFGFGALGLPLAIGRLIETAGLRPILLGAAALVLMPSLAALTLRFPGPKQTRGLPFRRVLTQERLPLVALFAALLFFQSGAEFVIGGYVPTFLTREIGAAVSAASYLFAGYWAALMVARVLLSRWLLRIPGESLVPLCAAGSLLATASLIASRTLESAGVAVIALGFSISGIFPTVLGVAGTWFRDASGTVFGLLFTVALTGGMLAPWLAGRAAEAGGLRWGLSLLPAAFAAIVFISLEIRRRLRS
jgi:FHS family glucose/mannose:H+ symporter-like MFS transporter